MIRFSPRANRAGLIRWREWEEAAFREAQQQDKPIFLFIGAFWCGFCQRMDETSFSDDEAIALLNAFFVPMRVEESQRPDIDLRYNQNGWPTIVLLTPSGEPILSVNSLEPEPLINLLARFVDRWERRSDALLSAAGNGGSAQPPGEREQPAPLRAEIVAEIAGMVEGLADTVHGGYGGEDKLLHTDANEFFLYLFEATGEQRYLDHVLLTLDKLRHSKTFDAENGGFYRYSSRRDWQEPHREKLLADQAALLSNYLHAFVLTGSESCRETADGLVDYLNSTLLDPENGAFHGCQDYLRPESAKAADIEALTPVIDTCVYCDANARAISAYLSAWWLLGRDHCRHQAEQALDWLWSHLRVQDGGMCHYWDGQAHAPGLLIDSVAAGVALLDAYAAVGESSYLERSLELAEHILERHRASNGGFFDISTAGAGALKVPMTVLAQNADAAAFFARLAVVSGEGRYLSAAGWALQPFPNSHRKYGVFAAGFGHALAQLLSPPAQMTIAGRPGDPRVRLLVREAMTTTPPRRLVLRYRAVSGDGVPSLTSGFPS